MVVVVLIGVVYAFESSRAGVLNVAVTVFSVGNITRVVCRASRVHCWKSDNDEKNSF